MAKLYIKRNTGWLHYSSKIKIMINGKKVFSLKDDEINHTDLEPGEYKISAKIWGYGGVERNIVVQENEHINFNLNEGSGLWKHFFSSILILFIIYFCLGSSTLLLITPALTGMFYLTFLMKRNKNAYFELEKVEV